MRSLLVLLAVVATGCGGPQLKHTDWNYLLVGRYRIEHVRHELEGQTSLSTCELLDSADPTKVVARVEHWNGEARYEPDGNRNILALKIVNEGHEAWRLVVYDEDAET